MGIHDPEERRVTAGGKELRKYLDAVGISVPVFCERHGLDRIMVQRVLTGVRWQRISVDFAHAIEKATDGRVKWTSFLSKTAKAA